MQQLRSLDKIESLRAQTQLYEIEDRIKSHNDNYLSAISNKISRAHSKVHKAELGHEKHDQMFQSLTEQRTLGVLNKSRMQTKKQKLKEDK